MSLLLGHKTTRHVYETYRRYRPKDRQATIDLLPQPSLYLDIGNIDRSPCVVASSMQRCYPSLLPDFIYSEAQRSQKKARFQRILECMIFFLSFHAVCPQEEALNNMGVFLYLRIRSERPHAILLYLSFFFNQQT